MTLRDSLDRLTADFARDVIKALRNASLEELTGRTATTPALTSAPVRRLAPPQAQSQAPSPRSVRAVPRAQPPLENEPSYDEGFGTEAAAEPVAAVHVVVPPEMRAAALRILEDRGGKGATAVQLDAELSLQGFAALPELMRSLVETGAVRDTGFRRASGGNATSAVYVLAGGSRSPVAT